MGIVLEDYGSSYIIFAGPDVPGTVEKAIQYCKDNNLTPDQVRIVRQKNQILVKIR